MEAQSQGLACLATRVSAIPELIEDGRTGALVPERSPGDFATALAALIGDPERRRRLGDAGQERVSAEFSHQRCIDRLAAKFSLPAHDAQGNAPSARRVQA